MKTLHIKILYIIFILFLTIGVFTKLKSLHNIDRISYIFQLNEDIETLIIGDSHPMTALDPNIIKRSKNICAGNENYIFTYLKLKHFLSNNPKIKNVIIGFSNHNVSKRFGERFLYHDATGKYLYDRYYLLLDKKAKNTIKSFRKNFIIPFLKYDLGFPIQIYKDKHVFNILLRKKLKLEDLDFFDGFYTSDLSNVNSIDIKNRIKNYFYNENNIYPGTSNHDIEYLYKILDICKNRNIRVYLYNSPKIPSFKNLIPLENVEDFEEVKNKILYTYKQVEYIDHSDYPLDERYFGDGDHINIKGAKIVSDIINKRITIF